MIWSKQFYNYVVRDWLDGDPLTPPPPPQRKHGRNAEWKHVYNDDVLSMPDTWEYPWYAAWDLAFHMITFGLIDPEFAKRQLTQLTREWYMHPSGQLPGVRVGVRRREPAGARVGRAAPVPHRGQAQRRRRRLPLSRAHRSRSC